MSTPDTKLFCQCRRAYSQLLNPPPDKDAAVSGILKVPPIAVTYGQPAGKTGSKTFGLLQAAVPLSPDE